MADLRNPPNIFKHATRELSVDAYLCWLVSWSYENFKTSHPELYKLSRMFLQKIDETLFPPTLEITSINIKSQMYHTDILVCINKDLLLHFENKVKFNEGNKDQLMRYKTVLANKFADKTRRHVYLKLGLVWYEENIVASDCGYKIIDLYSLAEWCSSSSSNNDIQKDFSEYVTGIATTYKSFEHSFITGKWDTHQYYGYLHHLSKQLNAWNRFGKYHSGNNCWLLLRWDKLSDAPACAISMSIAPNNFGLTFHFQEKGIDKRKYLKGIKTVLENDSAFKGYVIKPRSSKNTVVAKFKDFKSFSSFEDSLGYINSKKEQVKDLVPKLKNIFPTQV